MSTHFPGWCCCQEILIHDEGFLQIGDRANLRSQGPSGRLCLSGGGSTWQLGPEKRDHLRGRSSAAHGSHPVPRTTRLFLEGNHFWRLSPRDASYRRPLQECFRMSEAQLRLQRYGDASVRTVAKYAISLKQWGNGGGGKNVL